jgi:hypothetical protein
MADIMKRLGKVEKQLRRAEGAIVFIDAENTQDFQKQIRDLIEAGLDPEGRKFVYVEDPLTRLLKEIEGTSRGLPSIPRRDADR